MLGTLIILTIIAIAVIGGALALTFNYNYDDYINYFKNEAKAPCTNADYDFLSHNAR